MAKVNTQKKKTAVVRSRPGKALASQVLMQSTGNSLAAGSVLQSKRLKLVMRSFSTVDLDALSQSILDVKAFSRARRASDELSPELMSTPVSV